MTTTDDQALDVELGDLRAALRDLAPPPVDEQRLRAAFQAARLLEARPAVVNVMARPRRRYLAAAVVAVVAVGSALVAARFGRNPGGPLPDVSPASDTSPVAASPIAAFQPLSSSPGFASSGSYSIVRVRIPLTALALVPGTEQGGTIDADLLVGEDGLARGIRFTQADTRLVSVQD